MEEHRIDHRHNEASALLSIVNRDLLDAFGWQEGFWIANDEKKVHKALATLGRTDEGAWEVVPLKAKRTKGSSEKATADCEAFARAGSWIYVFGSQFGPKEGPLDPERHFVARLNESLVAYKKKKLHAAMDVAREPLFLHRLINDALRDSDLTLIRRSVEEATAYIEATASCRDEDWLPRLEHWDWPINVEGAAFAHNGRLLLGLRYPVTADGNPIVVELEGIDRLFVKKLARGVPRVTRVWALAFVGSPEQPLGIRALETFGRAIHVIVGDLDGKPGRSQILAGHPEGHHGHSHHYVFHLPLGLTDYVEARELRGFCGDANVEGMTVAADGAVWYIHDDKNIRLQRAHFDPSTAL